MEDELGLNGHRSLIERKTEPSSSRKVAKMLF